MRTKNGLPTKRALQDLMDEFSSELWRVKFSHYYGRGFGTNELIWQDSKTDEAMKRFIHYARGKGVVFGKYRQYESPVTGAVEVIGIK